MKVKLETAQKDRALLKAWLEMQKTELEKNE